MKISPYLSFDGNCADAIAFYEKVFGVKAAVVCKLKDAPESYKIPPGAENNIMHAHFEIDGEFINLCDTTPEYPITKGNNVSLLIEFDLATSVKTVFNALKEGGEVCEELQETFWSKLYGSVIDKFGIFWMVSLGCPTDN